MRVPEIVATTERLWLRELTPEDAAGMFALNANEEVLRYTGDAPFASVEAAREFLASYDHYRRHEFGRWAVVIRNTGAFAGFCGLKRNSSDGAVDLGFRIARELWGYGYATEAARAALDLGFGRYGLSRIIARAMPGNAASHRVLRKLSFVEVGDVVEADGTWTLYELTTAPPR